MRALGSAAKQLRRAAIARWHRRLALKFTSPLWGGRRASCALAPKRARWGERSKRRSIFAWRDLTPHPTFFARARSEGRPPHKGEVGLSVVVKRSFIFYFVLSCMLSLFSDRAVALDPAFDMNQYAHTAWRI